MGGDYYDFLMIDPEHLGVAIADVSGKGIPGSLVMTMTRSLLRMAATGETSPARTVELVNRFLTPDMNQGMFVTLLSEEDVQRINSLRIILEAEALKLARANMTPEMAAELSELVERMEAWQGSLFDAAALDLEFHRAVWRASNNPYLAKTLDPGSQYFNGVQYTYDFTGDGRPDVINGEFTQTTKLYVNPAGQSRRWDTYTVTDALSSEIALLEDTDGDGKLEYIFKDSNNQIVSATPDPATVVTSDSGLASRADRVT